MQCSAGYYSTLLEMARRCNTVHYMELQCTLQCIGPNKRVTRGRPRLGRNPAGDAHPDLNYHLCIVCAVQCIVIIQCAILRCMCSPWSTVQMGRSRGVLECRWQKYSAVLQVCRSAGAGRSGGVLTSLFTAKWPLFACSSPFDHFRILILESTDDHSRIQCWLLFGRWSFFDHSRIQYPWF